MRIAMKVTITLDLQYETNKEAKKVFDSVHVDDASFMRSTIEKERIHTEIETTSVPSMLHTVDDYLSCIRVAEDIIKKDSSKNKK